MTNYYIEQYQHRWIEQNNNFNQNDDIDDITNIIKQKINASKDLVLEIKLQIEKRKELHNEITNSIENMVSFCNTKMMNLPNSRVFGESVDRRNELEKLVASFFKEKINQEVLFWKDINSLQKDLRYALKEHSSIMNVFKEE